MIISGIEVDFRRKKIRNMHLRVRSDGSVYVSAPMRASMSGVEAFVSDNMEWITERRMKILKASEDDEGMTSVLGRKLPLTIITGPGNRYRITESAVYITVTDDDAETEEYVLKEMHRSILKDVCPPILEKWSNITGLRYNEWRTKTMKSRWGTCNVREKRIWLNTRLAEKPVECIEYVVLHEIMHLRYPDHGEGFKSSMTKYMPDWKERRKRLNGR